ncbi:MAG TPA: 30S ribosomal protein S16 [Candidatus Babeliales bacterium]|nr:30S ribosomal protein S16 [Candidatus Babeliales bacterium]
MAVKIRLSRVGKKSAPFYRIVAVDSRKKRDGAFLEDLGTYDSLGNKVVRIEEDRIADWMSKGAQQSDTVKKIYKEFRKASGSAVAPKPAAAKAKKAKAEKPQA